MKKVFVTAVLTSLFASTNAMADFTLGAKAGTLGVGLEATMSMSPTTNLRFGINKFDREDSQTIDDIAYDTDVDYKSALVALDWHPFSGIFRLSVGAVLNKNELTLDATTTSNTDIGGATYPAGTNLTGNVKSKNGAYAALGWSKSPESGVGVGLTAEIGAIFGKPDVTLSSGTVNAGDLSQEEQDIEDDLKVYPVISLGLSFGF